MKTRKNLLPLLGTAASAALAACLIFMCLSMYFSYDPASGESMYSYARVQAHFVSFAPAYIFLISVLIALFITGLIKNKKSAPCSRSLYRRSPSLSRKRALLIRTPLIIVSAVLIVLGIANGGLHDVFVKAVNICTECIGLG